MNSSSEYAYKWLSLGDPPKYNTHSSSNFFSVLNFQSPNFLGRQNRVVSNREILSVVTENEKETVLI